MNPKKKRAWKKHPQTLPIGPLIIKNDKNKTVGVYLNLDVYDSIIKEIKEYHTLIKRDKEKNKKLEKSQRVCRAI